MIDKLTALLAEATAELAAADTAEKVEAARVKYLGRKGTLRALQQGLGKLDPSERPAVGKRFNEVNQALKEGLKRAQAAVGQVGKAGKPAETFDPTLPPVPPRRGRTHVLVQTIEEITDILGRLGFQVAEGPEIEDEWHNFVALNIPEDHPARDPLDNFYINDGVLLRSQTSTVQIRVMEAQPPPVRVTAIGRTYRPDTVDATHSFMFHQVEGLMVDTDVTMADLKAILLLFVQMYLGPEVRIRFRPSFFPFTEPSVEVDMSWGQDDQEWIELGGAGMVDPNVLSAVGYDPDVYSGFAFGLGVERLAMRRHGISDLRLLFENNVRFLRQF